MREWRPSGDTTFDGVVAPGDLEFPVKQPTLTEVGFSGMRAAQWVAAFAQSALPNDIAETLNRAFAKAMVVPEMQAAFTRGGMVPPQVTTLDDARAWLRGEMANWKRDVEEYGIVVEE